MKILPVVAELFRAGGRTDKTKLIVAFRIFVKCLKMDPPPPKKKVLDVDFCIYFTLVMILSHL
jgi:hypothetical protein